MRRWGATAAAAMLAATCIVTGGRAGAAPAPPLALRPLGAVDLTALNAEALQVLTRDEQAAVDQASGALTSAVGTEQTATSTLANDEATEATAAGRSADAAQSLATTTASHTAAVTAHTAAVQSLTTDQDHLADIGIGLYIGPPPAVPDDTTDLSGADTTADGLQYLDEGRTELVKAIGGDKAAEKTTATTEQRLAAQVTTDQHAVSSTEAAATQATSTVTSDQLTVAAAKQAATQAQTTLATTQKQMAAALAAFGKPAPDGSPTIMGTPAMVPAQLASWFTSSSYDDMTAATPAQLAAWYVSEGGAEGVRGDVAFAQAVVETGGFSSPDAISLNNYAGVGHCDSCAAGLAFPSPQGGVRGQVQLLRIFASPAGTPLTQPAIIPQVAPGGQFRGACCPSWQSLTGTWATDPNYGQTVLTVYQRILDHALSQPPVVPGSPAAGDDPPSPQAPATASG